ncbi:hypothetical protein P3T37_005465 [Kitasatospora sp. MAA4]|uniref:SMI1/KNR4 family protein n=1 Tax=Kitasatospora sp. MAA4 TaxID=3035093 RepID=UPI0024738822|nr:SMI1/KNR4 family protein [Kitasatospora sp. MAA4]MDH6136046.1 hypothetical protein [Kitasatospora sp. MAA4]
MSNDDDLLRRVAERARSQAPVLAAPVSVVEIAAVEAELGFALPVLLRRLYGEVANGGFGPEYLLFPLVGDGETVVSVYRAECAPDDAEPSDHWPRGVLPVLTWGCGMYAAVDCLRPGGPVLLFEPNAGPDDWADAWFQDSPSLAEWLKSWLSGTGWWADDEELMDEDGEFAEPTPPSICRSV